MIGGRTNPEDSETTARDIFLGATTLFLEIVLSFVIAIYVKWLEPSLSVAVILFFRYLFCLPLLFIYGVMKHKSRLLHINKPKVLALRTFSGLTGLSVWFLALTLIDISLATALSQTMPIFITILAAFILGEKVGIRRIGAVVFGFVGVIILLGPTQLSGISWGIIFGMLAPIFGALMFIFLRMLGRGESPVSTALWYNMTGTLVMGSIIMFWDLSFPSVDVPINIWMMLVGIGALASLQQLLMAASHAYAPASVLAPVHYTTIPLGFGVGVVFFDEQLTTSFLIGTAVILMANYYILVRERGKK